MGSVKLILSVNFHENDCGEKYYDQKKGIKNIRRQWMDALHYASL